MKNTALNNCIIKAIDDRLADSRRRLALLQNSARPLTNSEEEDVSAYMFDIKQHSQLKNDWTNYGMFDGDVLLQLIIDNVDAEETVG